MVPAGSTARFGPMTRLGSMITGASMSADRSWGRSCGSRATGTGPMRARSATPGSGSGPALVISSRGAPLPRDSQPATNGRRCCAAFSTAGRTEA